MRVVTLLSSAILGIVIGSMLQEQLGISTPAPVLAALGIVGLGYGLRWYGSAEMGLRGRRPLFAGIGFAFLGWMALLLARIFVVIEFENLSSEIGRIFLYTFIYEALCVQLLCFGTLFRSLADARGAIAAAIGSGLLFGLIGYLYFANSFPTTMAPLFFGVWGVLYGFIRLRTGSLWGTTIVQALQTLTVWTVLPAPTGGSPDGVGTLYVAAALLMGIIIWRLWPKEEADFRI